jgi:hypothetical protein
LNLKDRQFTSKLDPLRRAHAAQALLAQGDERLRIACFASFELYDADHPVKKIDYAHPLKSS